MEQIEVAKQVILEGLKHYEELIKDGFFRGISYGYTGYTWPLPGLDYYDNRRDYRGQYKKSTAGGHMTIRNHLAKRFLIPNNLVWYFYLP